MPMSRAVLITRQAISPRLAIRIFLNICRPFFFRFLAARKGARAVTSGRRCPSRAGLYLTTGLAESALLNGGRRAAAAARDKTRQSKKRAAHRKLRHRP